MEIGLPLADPVFRRMKASPASFFGRHMNWVSSDNSNKDIEDRAHVMYFPRMCWFEKDALLVWDSLVLGPLIIQRQLKVTKKNDPIKV